jgi:anti-anti-sigma factor
MHGDFDLSNKRELAEALQPYIASQTLTVDLSNATFIDASTLGVFVHIARRRGELNASRLRIIHGNPHFRRIFSLCELNSVFDIEERAARTAQPPFFVARSLAFTALP